MSQGNADQGEMWAMESCICVDVTELSEHRQNAEFEDVYQNVLLYII